MRREKSGRPRAGRKKEEAKEDFLTLSTLKKKEKK